MGIASTQHHSRFPSSIVCSSSTTLSAFPPPFFFSFLSFVVRIKKGKKKNWRTSPFHIEDYPTLLFHSTLVLVVPVDNDEVSLQWPSSSHLLARTCPSGGWAALFVCLCEIQWIQWDSAVASCCLSPQTIMEFELKQIVYMLLIDRPADLLIPHFGCFLLQISESEPRL